MIEFLIYGLALLVAVPTLYLATCVGIGVYQMLHEHDGSHAIDPTAPPSEQAGIGGHTR